MGKPRPRKVTCLRTHSKELHHFQVPMAEEGAVLKVTKDLKAAVSAILHSYGDGQGPVTDTSAELHRLCGCLELLLQFDQKERRNLLGPRKGYWDFLSTALRRQRGDTEQARFVCSQDKLKTSLGKGRAFIRFCLARGQLAESLQLCLLSPELTREWYGPRSPLLCPELREDILDSLYALNGVAFHLDLQQPDLDGAWPLFSESRCSSSTRTQGRRPRKTKGSPKEVPLPHLRSELPLACLDGTLKLSSNWASPSISAALGGPRGAQLEGPHTSQADRPQDAPREDQLPGLPRSQQHRPFPSFLEKKKEDYRGLNSPQSTWEPGGEDLLLDQEEEAPRTGKFLENSTASILRQREGTEEAQKMAGMEAGGRGVLPGAEARRTTENTHEEEAEWGHGQGLLAPNALGTIKEAASGCRQRQGAPSILGETWVLQGLGTKEGSTTEKPQEQTRVTSVAKREHQAEVPLQEVVKSLRHELHQAEQQVQRQEQLLCVQDGELWALREQLSRCQGERAQLWADLEQKRREAKQRDAAYEEELGAQRELVQALKRRVLELIHEKDQQWQRLQQAPAVAPRGCMGCSKVFGRLSRRYPCRLCGGLVCHSCSADYKKREHCCPPCAQGGEAQVT